MTDYIEKEEKLRKQIQNLENQEKILKREVEAFRRKERSHRLIIRGAILEKHLKNPLILTDEDISDLMKYAFLLEPVDERLNKLINKREDLIINKDPGNNES